MVLVWSGYGLFPVMRPDFQALAVVEDQEPRVVVMMLVRVRKVQVAAMEMNHDDNNDND